MNQLFYNIADGNKHQNPRLKWLENNTNNSSTKKYFDKGFTYLIFFCTKFHYGNIFDIAIRSYLKAKRFN